MRPIEFKVEKKEGIARAGILKTPHGEIKTPAFVPVATKADVKGVEPTKYKDLGIQTVICNTYHLYLSPGEELIAKAGGLHQFMGFDGPLITDSGGFQVFSLGEGFGKGVSKFLPEHVSEDDVVTVYDEDVASQHGKLAIVDEEGVTFTSHVDGSLHRFTPERSVEIQQKLGSDIFFAFDQCTAPTSPFEFQKEAMERTHTWAKRSLKAHRQNIDANNKQAIYGIGQGGPYDDLRRQSAREIGEMGFDGFGLGGSFSRKYGDNSLQSALNMLTELPEGMPVHGLGVSEPEDILLGAAHGVDTFDGVTPTRNGRTGGIFTKRGKIQIPNAEFKEDFSPLDEGCECPTCQHHTRAYVHHLFRTKELLGPVLASMHNIYFLTHLTTQIRESILNGNFNEFHDTFLAQYKQ
ncbi:tRNA guanosine(34) transglycosylase Tgt [Candidatus Parcubacteria bacterium]|nr:tRNA guanosine(34) transglycosylase Tgt [Candidatus Parcubacteria bacterium]